MGLVEKLLRQIRHNPGLGMLSQVVPTKVLNVRFGHYVVEPVPPIFDWLPGLRRLEHTPSAFAPAMRNPQGGNRSYLAGCL